MSDAIAISGVFAALPTPYDDKKALDPKALEHLVDYLSERKIQGFALLTEAAEDALLTPEERRQIIKLVTGKLKGKKKSWIVAVSAASTHEAVELAKHAEQKGAQGVIVTPLRVPGIGYRELYRHLDRVARGVQVPVLLHARPGNAVDGLLPEELEALMGHPGLRGVLAPHATPSGVEAWAKRMKGRPGGVLTGCSLAPRAPLKAGASGFVCGLATIAAELAGELWGALKMDARQTAERLEAQLAPVVEALGPPIVGEAKDGVARLATKIAKRPLESGFPPAVPFALIKEALKMQGHPIRAEVRSPYESPKPDAIERLRAVLAQGGVLP